MSAAVTTPGTRQKTMLEAKKRLNFDAEVWQLSHNNCHLLSGQGVKWGIVWGQTILLR